MRFHRARRTGTAIATIYLGYKGLELADRGGLKPIVGRVRKHWHANSARILQRAAVDLGGLLLKAGQFVGTRADKLPPAYIDRLARLQDHVPAHDYPVIRKVIETELGRPPEVIFARFWRRPVASASLAQVHRATLRDGREVVVKIQRPEIADSIRCDFQNLRLAARALERIEGPLGMRRLLEELEQTVPRELDFLAEAHSTLRMKQLFEGDTRVLIPEPVLEFTTHRLLVTQYLPGVKITFRRKLEHIGIDPGSVVQQLIESYLKQILEYGFFHADPHPGNLFVVAAPETPTGFRIGFVDFGLVQETPVRFRQQLGRLLHAVLAEDRPSTREALTELGIDTGSTKSETMTRISDLLIKQVRARPAPNKGTDAIAALGRQLGEVLRSDPLVRLPAHLVLIARVAGLLGGVAYSLGARPNFGPMLLPYLMQPV